jgi:hypothetical protein
MPGVLQGAWRGATRAPGYPRAPRGPPPARFAVDASESRVVQLALSASTASGTRSITRRRARAAPCGTSLPCSQPRTVATDMPIRRANSACDSPARLRTRRTQAAASLAASASSKAAWRSISASVVASTRAQSASRLYRLPRSGGTPPGDGSRRIEACFSPRHTGPSPWRLPCGRR